MAPPANRARGEVICTLAGAPRSLCLTLGALAEIETALGLESPAGLGERLRAPGARDLVAVLQALLRGGGETGFAQGLVAERIEPDDAVAAIAAALAAATREP